jgi:hypothetical protein
MGEQEEKCRQTLIYSKTLYIMQLKAQAVKYAADGNMSELRLTERR